MSSDFTVKTEGFEGPLDLLLNLIEKRKMLINEVSLAQVTDDYLEHIKQFDTVSLNDVSSFVVVASTLLLIKSRSLLPKLELTTEEEGDIEQLEKRLRIYKKIKEAEPVLEKLFGKKILFETRYEPVRSVMFAPGKNITTDSILEALQSSLKLVPKPEKKQKASIAPAMNLEQMIGNLVTRIQGAMQMSFKDFSGSHSSKDAREARIHTIVSFLAMLELVKQGNICVTQDNHFEDIHMNTQQEEVIMDTL